MHRSVKQCSVLILTFVFAAALAGCDLFSPKKTAKKPAAVPAEQAAAAAPADQGPLPADVIARVGSWTLSADQFNARLKLLKQGLPDFDENKPGNKEAVLNELIRQQLLVKDAEDGGIGQQKDITDAVEDFRRTLLVQELAGRLTKDIAATEAEAQDYYNKNKNAFVEPVQWKVREIVVADEATAKNILVQVLQGGDFAAIAQAQSTGKTAANGGALPAFAKAPSEEMQKAISSLDAGGTSPVFRGPEGYSIVKVDEKKGGAAKSFAAVKADLISGLTLRKQQEAILKHIEDLSSKIKVEVNKGLLGDQNGK